MKQTTCLLLLLQSALFGNVLGLASYHHRTNNKNGNKKRTNNNPQAGLTAGGTTKGTNKKQLILLVGPHGTDTNSIAEFFVNHASSLESTTRSPALHGWNWPIVPEDQRLHHPANYAFDLLVQKVHNKGIQDNLMESISNAWDDSTHGIILGTELFDLVGVNDVETYRTTDTAGLHAMSGIVHHLGLELDQIHVVINYRAPRVDQWINIWHHTTLPVAGGGLETVRYQNYVCDGSSEQLRKDTLATSMNPLRVAQKLRHQGWEVHLIDTKGVQDKNLDVAHTVACEVLNYTTCEDGWVKGLKDQQYTVDNSADSQLAGLSKAHQVELDELFLARDCHYKALLETDAGFSVLFQDQLWQNCEHTLDRQSYYESLVDTSYMLDQIRQQKGCGQGMDPPPETSNDTDTPMEDSMGQFEKLVQVEGLESTLASLILGVALLLVLLLAMCIIRRRSIPQKGYDSLMAEADIEGYTDDKPREELVGTNSFINIHTEPREPPVSII